MSVRISIERLERVLIEREVERSELGKALGPLAIHSHQTARVSVDAGLACAGVGISTGQALSEERQDRLVTLGRQIEPRQRGRDDFRRGGLEVEQQAERVGQIEIGEVAQDDAVDLAVEEAGQDRPAQERLPAVGIEIEHSARQLREHDAGDARVERREQHRHVAELLRQRLRRRHVLRHVVVGQAQQHRGERRRIVRHQRQVYERDVRQVRRRIEPDPALVRRVEMIDDPALGEELLAPLTLLIHEAGHGAQGGRRSAALRGGTPAAA